MKKSGFYFYALIVINMLSACNDHNNIDKITDAPITQFFVNRYIDPNNLECYITSGGLEVSTNTSRPLSIDSLYIYLSPNDSTSTEFTSWNRDKALNDSIVRVNLEKFRTIAKQNGDTAYYRPIESAGPDCFARRIDRIEIYCKSNYDQLHPKGAALNDICTIKFGSALEYVKSNYTNDNVLYEKSVVQMALTQFNKEKRRLVATQLALKLVTPPQVTGSYIFTVHYYDEVGKHLAVSSMSLNLKGNE